MLIKEDRDRINFIDKNDCFVGFDWYAQCCESFGYYVAIKVTEDESLGGESLDGFFFDTSTEPVVIEHVTDNCVYADDEDAVVAFKCINDSGDVRYLHLYNHHNGYYSHGWGTSWGGSGSL